MQNRFVEMATKQDRLIVAFLLLLFLLVGFSGGSANACPLQEQKKSKAENIRRTKKATALVVVQRGTGSGFCIHESGIFITNQHVVKKYKIGDTVEIVLDSSTEEEKRFEATIERTNEEDDLAVLSVVGKHPPFTAIDIGNSEGLVETDEIIAFGFPFGRSLATNRKESPAISINVGRVTSLRRKEGKLSVVQIDAQVNPGNSGGPIISGDGVVVGVVAAGIKNSGVHFAIPAEHVKEMLVEPLISFNAPKALKSSQLEKKLDLSAVITTGPWSESPGEYKVSLDIKLSGSKKRTVQLDPVSDGLFTQAIDVIARKEIKDFVTFKASFDSGTVEALVKDVAINVNGKDVPLNEVQSITRLGDGNYSILKRNSKKARGKIGSALGAVPVRIGNNELKVDLTAASRIFFPVPTVPDEVELLLEVFDKEGQKVGSLTHTVDIENDTPVATEIEPRDNRIVKSATIKLPGEIGDSCIGGNGRYMLCLIPKTRKVAIIDLAQAKVAKYVSVPSARVKIAAGLDKFVVVTPDKGIISRYDLSGSFEKELTKEIEGNERVATICMGSASQGPIFIGGVGRFRGGGKILNLKSLRPAEIKTGKRRFELGEGNLRASADGKTIGYSRTQVSPKGIFIYQLQGNELAAGYTHTSAGTITPSPDGNYIHTSYGPFPAKLKEYSGLGRGSSSTVSFPAVHGPMYGRVEGYPGYRSSRDGNKPRISLHYQGNDDKIATLPQTDKFFESLGDSHPARSVDVDKRVVLAPNIGVVAFRHSDFVEVRPFNLNKILKESEIDYLVVSSAPVTTANAGTSYRYPIKVLSKAGGVKLNLDSGPDGMELGIDGVLHWEVGEDAADEDHTVIITVADKLGQEMLHTFEIRVK